MHIEYKFSVICTTRNYCDIRQRPTDKRFAIILAELIKAVSRCSDRYAFVKLLHLFFSKMHKDSSRASTIISRRCSSSVDIPATRRPTLRELTRSQKSFEIPGMQRSALRLLGMCLRSNKEF